MDLGTQEAILRLVNQHGKDKLLVLLGAPDGESAEISAETVIIGDPTYAGPLAEAQLGLDVYHILEEEIRSWIPAKSPVVMTFDDSGAAAASKREIFSANVPGRSSTSCGI